MCACMYHGVLRFMGFVIVMLLSNQIFELESHKVEWMEVIMGAAVKGQHPTDKKTLAFQVHAALSEECTGNTLNCTKARVHNKTTNLGR